MRLFWHNEERGTLGTRLNRTRCRQVGRSIGYRMSATFEENEFLCSFGDQYGYSGQIDRIRKEEFSRIEGNGPI